MVIYTDDKGAEIHLTLEEVKTFRTILNRTIGSSNYKASNLAAELRSQLYPTPESKPKYRQVTLEEAINNELTAKNDSGQTS